MQEQNAFGGFIDGALDFLEDLGTIVQTGIDAAGDIAEVIRGNGNDYLGGQGTGGSGDAIPQDVPVYLTGGFLFLAGIVALVIAFAD